VNHLHNILKLISSSPPDLSVIVVPPISFWWSYHHLAFVTLELHQPMKASNSVSDLFSWLVFARRREPPLNFFFFFFYSFISGMSDQVLLCGSHITRSSHTEVRAVWVFLTSSDLPLTSALLPSTAWVHVHLFLEKMFLKPYVLTHTCNPSYLGGGNQEDCSLRPVWAKSESPSQSLMHVCDPSWEAVGKRIKCKAGPRQKCKIKPEK
jgi:hypothetical protein